MALMPRYQFPPLWDDPWAQPEADDALMPLALEPPAYEEPALTGVQPLGFRDRLALGMQNVRPYSPSFGESGGSAFARGLIGGAARGFSTAGLTRMQQGERDRMAANEAARGAADRNYKAKWDTYLVRLKDQLDAARDEKGNVTLSQADAEAMGVPSLAGKPMPSKDAAQLVGAAQARKQEADRFSMTFGETARHNRAMENKAPAVLAGYGNPDDVERQAQAIWGGILEGRLDPNLSAHGTPRSPIRNRLDELSALSGVDLGRMQLSWFGEKRGLSTANSPQQNRMRQAAETIPVLLPQARALADALNNSNIKLVNRGRQIAAEQSGSDLADLLNQYRTVINKLASEQAFLQVGGNDPPVELIRKLYNNMDPSQSPKALKGAFSGVEATLGAYTSSIQKVGPVTPLNPYQYPGASNPIGGPQGYAGPGSVTGVTMRPGGFSVEGATGYVKLYTSKGEPRWIPSSRRDEALNDKGADRLYLNPPPRRAH